MKVITLTNEQVQAAHSLATKIKSSKPYTMNWDVSSISIGVLGEMAYAAHSGQTVCEKVWADKCDGGVDFEDGTDVKTITWTGPSPELKMGRLPMNSKKKKLVLAICDYKKDPNTVMLMGEISYENFKLKARLKTYGDKSWYAVTADELDVTYN